MKLETINNTKSKETVTSMDEIPREEKNKVQLQDTTLEDYNSGSLLSNYQLLEKFHLLGLTAQQQ